MEQIAAPIKLCLTSKCHIAKKAFRIGETGAGFDMKGFDLIGRTGIKDQSYYTEGLNACTGGVVIGNKLNMFHENSSLYEDAENAKRTIFPEITNKILKMAQEAKEKIQVGLFGGWGYGSNKNTKEVDKSHNLFNSIALCIEENLPEKEGIEVPLLTVWGKRNDKYPEAVYARENTIILISDLFKSLFKKKGECNHNREDLIKFLKQHYEEVQIPDNVNIIAEETYTPPMGFMDNIKNKKVNLSV